MMTFRLHTIVAAMLLSTMIYAQSSSSASKPQATGAAKAASNYSPYPPMSEAAKERARKIFDMFKAGQGAAIWATSPAESKKRVSEQKYVASLAQLKTKLGPETKVMAETFLPFLLKRATVYTRRSQFANADVPVATLIVIDENGETQMFTIKPEPTIAEGHDAGYKDTVKLKLPFSGQWIVYEGGHGVFNNGYQLSEEQRFSMDFVLLKNGNPFEGDGTTNEQFYCFGQPVLAPGDGTVVRVVNDIGDNPPGQPSMDKPYGNMILIKHSDNEYSMLVGLKQNSIKLKHGDTVKQGDQVAECGNSGRLAAPMVHYQLQNSGGFPAAESLPSQFVDYIADGKPVPVGEVVKGQMVSNAVAPSVAPPATDKK
jgi:Peptidase family M23